MTATASEPHTAATTPASPPEAPLRPGQRLPPQPQHSAGAGGMKLASSPPRRKAKGREPCSETANGQRQPEHLKHGRDRRRRRERTGEPPRSSSRRPALTEERVGSSGPHRLRVVRVPRAYGLVSAEGILWQFVARRKVAICRPFPLPAIRCSQLRRTFNPKVAGSNPGGPIHCRKHNDVAAQEPFCVSGRMTVRAGRMRSAGWVPGLTSTLRLERVG